MTKSLGFPSCKIRWGLADWLGITQPRDGSRKLRFDVWEVESTVNRELNLCCTLYSCQVLAT